MNVFKYLFICIYASKYKVNKKKIKSSLLYSIRDKSADFLNRYSWFKNKRKPKILLILCLVAET